MDVAVSMIVTNARKAFEQIVSPGDGVAGYNTAWMRASPGAHLLALVFNEFYRLYSDVGQAELAMRHSLAQYWHDTTKLEWWPHNTMRAWRGIDATKLLKVENHGIFRTPGPTVPMGTRRVDPCTPSSTYKCDCSMNLVST